MAAKPVPASPEPEIASTVAIPASRQHFIQRLMLEVETQKASSVERIYDKIAAADTLEEIFEAAVAGLTKSEDILDTPLLVRGYSWNRSAIQTSELPVYAVLDAVNLDTGEEIAVSCSANSALRQLVRMDDKGYFPVRMVLTAKHTVAGYDAMDWRPFNSTEEKAYAG